MATKTTKPTQKSTKSAQVKAKKAENSLEKTIKPKKREATSGSYPKGTSGNPGGRPKLTDEQKDALEGIRKLAPRAVEKAEEILETETDSRVLIKLIEMILDRTYGKPYQAVRIDDTTDHSVTIHWDEREYGD